VKSKNCDKLFAYTSVFAAVTESRRICHAIRKVGLQILLASRGGQAG
jgi:hypothetical protein